MAGLEVSLAQHRLPKRSGVVSEVEAIELDIVCDADDSAVNDHGRSVKAKRLHLASQKFAQVRTM